MRRSSSSYLRCKPTSRAWLVLAAILGVAMAAGTSVAQTCENPSPITLPYQGVVDGAGWMSFTVNSPIVVRVSGDTPEPVECGRDEPYLALRSGCGFGDVLIDNWDASGPGGYDIESDCLTTGTYYLQVSNWFICELSPACCDEEDPQRSERPVEVGVIFQSCGVGIEVTPGGFPNSVNPRSRGVIPVAILGSDSFDLDNVDVTRLRFGPNEMGFKHDLTDAFTRNQHLQDVNLDGFTDLKTHFVVKDSGIACGDTSVTLAGFWHGGGVFAGTDSIRTVGCVRPRLQIMREREAQRPQGPAVPVPIRGDRER